MNLPRGLPACSFVVVGTATGGCELGQAYPGVWLFLIPLAVVRILLSFVVLRPRVKFFEAMMRNGHARWLAAGFGVLRFAIRAVTHFGGSALASSTGHVVVGIAMDASTAAAR